MRKSGAVLIAAERLRQIEQEGWSADHDDEHTEAQMVGAAHSYAEAAYLQINNPIMRDTLGTMRGADIRPSKFWTWNRVWWKPADDPLKNLVKAGALIAAEIDRLQREEARRFEIEGGDAPRPHHKSA